MEVHGDGLMASAPVGPSEDIGIIRNPLPDKLPKQAPDLGDAQADEMPRLVLNAAKLLWWDGVRPPFSSSGSALSGCLLRSTDKRAWAKHAMVI
jgi:hypothetical protein